MIQFIGLDLEPSRASVATLARDLSRGPAFSTAIPNVRLDEGGGGATIAPAEWLRAATYALQETWLELPAKERKLWGIAFSGPTGWIALDLDFEPLSELRLVPGPEVLDDARRWLDENPRLERRVALLLAPKDWVRFALSRSIATDVTTVSRMGALAGGEWDEAGIERRAIPRSWLAPVFESATVTGRLDDEGIRRSGLPGGLWVVAGAERGAAELAASCDAARCALWLPGDGRAVWTGGPEPPAAVPEGWRELHGPWPARRVLERIVSSTDGSEPRRELEAVGLAVEGLVERAADAAIGAALTCAAASPIGRDWDTVYRRARSLLAGDDADA